jgi:hypothetical protein
MPPLQPTEVLRHALTGMVGVIHTVQMATARCRAALAAARSPRSRRIMPRLSTSMATSGVVRAQGGLITSQCPLVAGTGAGQVSPFASK